MSKKKVQPEEPIFRPGICIRSLQNFNEAVVNLINVYRVIAPHLGKGEAREAMDNAVAKVNKFYED
jgi:hypothetical protein